jgi:hypothetical protein
MQAILNYNAGLTIFCFGNSLCAPIDIQKQKGLHAIRIRIDLTSGNFFIHRTRRKRGKIKRNCELEQFCLMAIILQQSATGFNGCLRF